MLVALLPLGYLLLRAGEAGAGRITAELLTARVGRLALLSLALAADLRIASTRATMTAAYFRLGLPPDGGTSAFLARSIGAARAVQLLLTNRILSADEMLAWGLLHQVVAPESLLDRACDLASSLTQVPPATLLATRALLDRAASDSLLAVLDAEELAMRTAARSPEFRAALDAFVADIASQDNVATAFPTPINENLALVIVNPRSAPQDADTTSLVNHLRDDVIPDSGVDAKVGGLTAASSDFADYMGDRMPLLIGVVLLLSFLLLMAVFRSVLVPLKAVVMNLLSIGAAYGVVVAVFQWGWGNELIGVDTTVPISPFLPMIMFAILFGLSMDYEVFLLSRVREEYVRTGDSHRSVVDGLAATARVITSAALIMISVFAAFLLTPDVEIKMFAVGLTVAVLVDATVVRMVLVPATMALMGDANWWLPGWLDRILPHVDVEGSNVLGHDAVPALTVPDDLSELDDDREVVLS